MPVLVEFAPLVRAALGYLASAVGSMIASWLAFKALKIAIRWASSSLSGDAPSSSSSWDYRSDPDGTAFALGGGFDSGSVASPASRKKTRDDFVNEGFPLIFNDGVYRWTLSEYHQDGGDDPVYQQGSMTVHHSKLVHDKAVYEESKRIQRDKEDIPF